MTVSLMFPKHDNVCSFLYPLYINSNAVPAYYRKRGVSPLFIVCNELSNITYLYITSLIQVLSRIISPEIKIKGTC